MQPQFANNKARISNNPQKKQWPFSLYYICLPTTPGEEEEEEEEEAEEEEDEDDYIKNLTKRKYRQGKVPYYPNSNATFTWKLLGQATLN